MKKRYVGLLAALLVVGKVQAVIIKNDRSIASVISLEIDVANIHIVLAGKKSIDIKINSVQGVDVTTVLKFSNDIFASDHRIGQNQRPQYLWDYLSQTPSATITIVSNPKDTNTPSIVLPEKEAKEWHLKELQKQAQPIITTSTPLTADPAGIVAELWSPFEDEQPTQAEQKKEASKKE